MARGLRKGYRSGLEEAVSRDLEAQGIEPEYETIELRYEVPISIHRYTPDFLLPNGIVIESKGRFTVEDRKKHVYIKEQLPDLDLRFVFSNPLTKINKKSKTTYAMWCEHNGFLYAKKLIPEVWILEPVNRRSLRLVERCRKPQRKK